jgi:hypothetical protein
MVRIARAPTCFLPAAAFRWAARVALAALALGIRPTQAAVTEVWAHHFSNVLSNSVDRSSQVVRDSASDIIVAGTSDNNASGPDILTIKYSGVDGSMLWQRRQPYSTSRDYWYSHGQRSLPVAIAVDASGNVVVSGSTESPENDTESESYTAKYARATGAVLWEKRYYDIGVAAGEVQALAVDRAGNVVVSGRFAILKYAAADGVLLWEKRQAALSNPATAIDGSGNVVLAGLFSNGTNNTFSTTKYAAADGGLLWEKLSGSASYGADLPSAVAVDASGNVIVTRYSQYNADENDQDYYTIKYAAGDGAVLWEQRRTESKGDSNYHQSPAIAVDTSGNVVVTGQFYSEQSGIDYHTVKYAAADGALLWEKRYDNPAKLSGDFAQAVALDANDNVVVTGFSPSMTSGDPLEWWRPFDIYTAKYAARDGTLLWERRYESNAYFFWNSPPTAGVATAVVMDESGNAIVTGLSFPNDIPFQSKPDYYTAKYAALDGAVLWEKIYNGSAHYESNPSAVALDSSGNVIVVADSDGESYTAKYSVSNGSLVWEKRLPGQAQLVVDDSDNLFVTGPALSGSDFYTAKYAEDGSLLWVTRHPEESTPMASMALDPLGNLVAGSGSYTAKYASSSGDLLWKQQPSTMNGSHQALAVAVDKSGNVAVTGGFKPNGPTRTEGYTAKYAALNGALIWESRSIGSGFADDLGHAVAVDRNGNVVLTTSNATLKYAAVDGALLWEQRYPNIRALALDGGGNVVITGSGGTRKLAAANGALLWQKPFGNGDSTALAIDDRGNVVVTGQSQGSLDIVKYAAADGGLLWEESYKEPGGFSNWAGGPRSLALGPNGMFAIIGTSYLSSTGPADVLTVMFREGLSALSVDPLLTGIRLSFSGTAQQSYSIQRAPGVTGPWNIINTQTAPASGLLEYRDANPPVGAAFYRTSTP